MMKRLKEKLRVFRREIEVYRRVLKDPRTPRAAKILLGLAIAYAASPIDIIPDFIPVLGMLDDLILVPLLVAAAVKLIPPEVLRDCREQR